MEIDNIIGKEDKDLLMAIDRERVYDALKNLWHALSYVLIEAVSATEYETMYSTCKRVLKSWTKDEMREFYHFVQELMLAVKDENFNQETFIIMSDMKYNVSAKKMFEAIWKIAKCRKMCQMNSWTMDWSPTNCSLSAFFAIPNKI